MAVEVHRKQYVAIFVWLTVLTVLEVAVVKFDISKGLLISALVLLAVAKAALVANYYMHLNHESPIMRRTVTYCLAIPVVYASVLIAEAAWRLLA